MRIGLLKEFFDKGSSPRTSGACARRSRFTRGSGARLSEVSLPNLPLSVPTYYVVAPAECSSNLSRFDGVRFGHRCESPRDLLDLYQRSRGEGFGAEVKRRIMTGTYVLSAGYYDAYYLKAQRVRQLIADDFARAFESVDVLIGPTTPTPAFALGAKTADPDHHVPERHLHHRREPRRAAGDVDPLRLRRADLPVGLQIIGPHFAEARLLTAAHALQRATDWHTPRARGVRMSGVGDRHRARDPCAARHALEDLLRLRDRLRRAAQRAGRIWSISATRACCRC